MQIGTVTISRPASLPIEGEVSQPSNVFVGGDGSVRARPRGRAAKLLTYKVRMTKAEKDALEAFIKSTARFRSATFTVVDDWGDSFLARYWSDSFRATEKLGRYYEASLPFRLEDPET